jgi:hypothetical protein
VMELAEHPVEQVPQRHQSLQRPRTVGGVVEVTTARP